MMGYAAVNVGAHELAVGVADVLRFGKLAKVAMLSANIRDAKTHEPIFQATWIRQVGPLKVGMIGLVTQNVVDPGKLVIDRGMEILDPISVARELVPQLRQQGVELVVVLSQLHRADIEALANRVPGIDLILGSTDSDLTMQPVTMGSQTLFVDAYTKGKYMAQVSIDVRAKRDRFWPTKMREALTAERAEAANQSQSLVSQLEAADKPDSVLKLTKDTRAVMEAQLAAARARMQRLTMQIEAVDGKIPQDASTVDLVQAALAQDVKDDPAIDKIVKEHLTKFPKLGSH